MYYTQTNCICPPKVCSFEVKYFSENCPLFVSLATDALGFNRIHYPHDGKINIATGNELIVGCDGPKNALRPFEFSSMKLTCKNGKLEDYEGNEIYSDEVSAYSCSEPNKPHFEYNVNGGYTGFRMTFRLEKLIFYFMEGMLDENFNALYTKIVQV